MVGDFLLVMRYFVISVVFIGVLQIETKGRTLENHATDWFYSSSVPQHIRTASKGGALMIENGFHSAKTFFKDMFGPSLSRIDKASR